VQDAEPSDQTFVSSSLLLSNSSQVALKTEIGILLETCILFINCHSDYGILCTDVRI
jgi:hypothetical protein